MSEIVLPAGFCPNAFTLWQITNQRVFASPYGGSEQTLDMGNDRWGIYLTLPNRKFEDAARVEAFIAALRGMTNTVRLYHWVRKVPRGTMRGTPTCQVTPAGSDQVMVYCPSGQTLLAGDMLGIQGLLLQVREDAVSDGSGHLIAKLVNRTRKFIPEGSVVTWDRPTALFRQSSQSARVQYIPGYAPEVSFDFVEVVS
ncbi:hypothetical protein [Variovorax atrisoli]|uniref:hypothetical protein n=1 Tax=Variovorax atrisoli TaxID=3394203 RepID=UPI003397420E